MGLHCFTLQLKVATSPVSKLSLPPQASTPIIVDKWGSGVLVYAFNHVMTSLRQVGSGDSTRILARLQASGQASS